MEQTITLVIGILQITLLNLALSGDNIGAIALATKNLPMEYARKASLIGISLAMIFRIIFASFVTYIMSTAQVIPVKLIGGLLLVKITWDFIKSGDEEKEEVKVANKFWEAIMVILIADISMSLDNVLAIAAAAEGNQALIIFGILLCMPIIFFGSQFVTNLMKNYAIVIYIAGAILAHTAFKMIVEDRFVSRYLNHVVIVILPWLMAILVMVYGFYVIKKASKEAIYVSENLSAPDKKEIETKSKKFYNDSNK